MALKMNCNLKLNIYPVEDIPLVLNTDVILKLSVDVE